MISAISGGMPLTSKPVRKIPLLGVVLLAGPLLAAGIAAAAQAQPARFALDAGGGKISVLNDDGSIWQAVGQQTRKSDTVTGQFLLPDGRAHQRVLHIQGVMVTASDCE